MRALRQEFPVSGHAGKSLHRRDDRLQQLPPNSARFRGHGVAPKHRQVLALHREDSQLRRMAEEVRVHRKLRNMPIVLPVFAVLQHAGLVCQVCPAQENAHVPSMRRSLEVPLPLRLAHQTMPPRRCGVHLFWSAPVEGVGVSKSLQMMAPLATSLRQCYSVHATAMLNIHFNMCGFEVSSGPHRCVPKTPSWPSCTFVASITLAAKTTTAIAQQVSCFLV